MSHWKTVGLFFVASLAIAAAIATPGASAKVCSTEGTGASCGTGHGNEWKGQLKFESTSVEFEFGAMKVTCTGSVGTGEVTKSETGAGKLTSLTFSGCKDQSGASCTASSSPTEGEPAEFTVKPTTKTEGFIEVTSITTTWSCIFFTCKYVSKPADLFVFGGETALVFADKIPETLESGFCSSNATLTGLYKVTKPDSLFIT
jgi:hypothetical protein